MNLHHNQRDQSANTAFALSRFRPGIDVYHHQYQVSYNVEFNEGKPKMMDAFAAGHQGFSSIFVGNMKPPLFASTLHEHIFFQSFQERSPVVLAFRIQRDMGFSYYWHPKKLPLEGWLRLGTGSDGVEKGMAIYANLDLVYGAFHYWSNGKQLKSERDIKEWFEFRGDDYYQTGLRLGISSLFEGAAPRKSVKGILPSNATFFQPVLVSGDRNITEAHLVLKLYWFRWTTEAAYSKESLADPLLGKSITAYGLTSELQWSTLDHRYSANIPYCHMPKLGQPGCLELAIRYDGLWMGRGNEKIQNHSTQGFSAVIKWYLFDFFSLFLSAYHHEYEIEEGKHIAKGLLFGFSHFWMRPI